MRILKDYNSKEYGLANHELTLLLAAVVADPALSLCLLLLACHMCTTRRRQKSLSISGSLSGGIRRSQWRHNLEHALNEEFKRLMRMEKAVFHKLVEICRPRHDKYQYDRQAHKLKIRTRKGNAKYSLSDTLGMTLEYLNTSSTLDCISQYFLTPSGVLLRHIRYGILILIKARVREPEMFL